MTELPPAVLTPEQNKELVLFFLCLGGMIFGPSILFEWQHRVEQERERKRLRNGSAPTR